MDAGSESFDGFEAQSDALPAADTHRHQRVTPLDAPQFIQGFDGDQSTGCADRMTERHRAGVDHQFAAQRVERQGDRCLIRWILGLVFQDHCLGAVVAQCAANGVLVSAAHARRAIRVSPSWLVQPAILLIGHPGNPPCCNQFLA